MFMRAQRFLSRNLTSVLAILMITSGLQILATTPASATNPVGSLQFSGNGSMVYSTGAPGSQNTTIEFWMKQTSTGVFSEFSQPPGPSVRATSLFALEEALV
jgi:hypothetical protein